MGCFSDVARMSRLRISSRHCASSSPVFSFPAAPTRSIADAARFQHHLFRRRAQFWKQLVDVAAHHMADDTGAVYTSVLSGIDALAIAQNRDAVRNALQLFHAVRNVDHGQAAGGEALYD